MWPSGPRYRKVPHRLIKPLLTCARCGKCRRGQKRVREVRNIVHCYIVWCNGHWPDSEWHLVHAVKNIVQCYIVWCNGHWPDSVWHLVHVVKNIGMFYGVFPLQHLQTQRKILPIGQRCSKVSHCVVKLFLVCPDLFLFRHRSRKKCARVIRDVSFTRCDVILTDLFPYDTTQTQRETTCPCDQWCEVSHCVMSFLLTCFRLTRADPERNVPVWPEV